MSATIELPEEQAARLQAQARAKGLSVPEFLEFLERLSDQQKPGAERNGEKAATEQERPVSAMIRDIVGDVPADELAKLPKDSASQIDHYVYGHPKR